MKELFDKFVGIIEQANGVRETMEAELKKYADANKAALEDAGSKIKAKFEEVMKQITDPSNFQEVMQKMMATMSEFIGEDNVKKIMEFQQKFPFLNEFMKNIVPQPK